MQITIDTSYLLKKKETNRFTTVEEPLNNTEKIGQYINDFITGLSSAQIIESTKQDAFDRLREKIKSVTPTFFSKYDWCKHIDGAYQDHFDRDLSDISMLNTTKLATLLDNYLKAYRLEQAYKKYSGEQDIIAYSHRRHGFNDFHFEINKEFKGLLKTNFGYGSSAYFKLVLYFNEVPIIPYSAVILYDQANAYSLIDYTRSYPVNENSWKTCLDFTKTIVNEFYDIGQKAFIEKHIVKSLEEFVVLLRSLGRGSIFFSTPIVHRLNTYLEIPNKMIYFEDSISSINFNALNKLIHLFKNSNMSDDVSKDAYQDIINDYLKENNQVYKTDDLVFLNQTATHLEQIDVRYEEIKRVMKDIAPHHSNMMTQKHDYELHYFRSRKVVAALNLKINLVNLNHYINTKKYVDNINTVAQDILDKNLDYLQSTLETYEEIKKQYQVVKQEFLEVEQAFHSSEIYHHFSSLQKVMTFFTDMASEDYVSNDMDNADDFDDTILNERIHIYQDIINDSISIDFLNIFQETRYKQSEIKEILNLFAQEQEINDAMLEQVNRLMKLWFTIMHETDSVARQFSSPTKLKAMLQDLQKNIHVLAPSFNDRFTYSKGLDLFERLINEYNPKVKDMIEKYHKEKQPVDLIKSKYKQIEGTFNKLHTQRQDIKRLSKIIKKKLD